MKKGKHGFTLVELLVVISIIALLLAILMPALSKVREQGRSVVCLSNLRQVGLANLMYIQDKGSYLVQNGYYAVYLAPYLSGSAQNPKQISKLFHCPSDKLNEKGKFFTFTFGSVNSYCINMYFDLHNSNRGKTELWKFLKVSDIRRPPSKVFFCEQTSSGPTSAQIGYATK